LIGTDPVPRPSAVVVPLVRDSAGGVRVLVGRRRSRFLGGFFAFPGGTVEPSDGDPVSDGDRCFRRTAVRELAEETGIRVEPEALREAGRRITPPFFPRRFDTRFYLLGLPGEVEPRPELPGEFDELRWAKASAVDRSWRELEIRVAPPLIPILQELAAVGTEEWDEIARRLSAVNAEMESGIGPRIEFVPGVLMIPLSTITLPPATTTNCYVVGSGRFAVIDPGGRGREAARLLAHLEARSGEQARPVAVVLTHHHSDHVGGAVDTALALGVPVFAHPLTWSLWSDGKTLAARGLARELRDGECIELDDGERLRALHTPGHAAGHLALIEERRRSLFAGDLVSGLSTILVDSAPGSLDLYLASLERIRDAGARTLFPAHGPPMISPGEDVQRVIDHRHGREAKILAALEGGAKSVEEIAARAYEDTPQAPASLAVSQTAAHLDRLVRLAWVRRRGDLWDLPE
jgi:glyoxylase-like metal-dependent hydrolase (beta-lactamase superfamily II)/8-oxo-dGTP pyrophosphatase MutT (NUDIX family)